MPEWGTPFLKGGTGLKIQVHLLENKVAYFLQDNFESIKKRSVRAKMILCIELVRFVLSAGLLGFSTFVTCYAIYTQKTGFYKEVPGGFSCIR